MQIVQCLWLEVFVEKRCLSHLKNTPNIVAMATMQLFGLFFKTQISIVFEVFPPEKTFCEITFYALDIKIV